jgi:hypothetical protein
LLNPVQQNHLQAFVSEMDGTSDTNTQFIMIEENSQWTNNGSALFNRRSVSMSSEYIAMVSPGKDPNTCLPYIWYSFDGGFSMLKDTESIYKNLSLCLKLRYDNDQKTVVLIPKSRESEINKIQTYDAKIVYDSE